MTSYVMNYKIPAGSFQRPVQIQQSNELNTTHSQPLSSSA